MEGRNGGTLKPFPKGQSGNPKGRPVGSKSRSTLVRYWLDSEENIKNPITKENQVLTQTDIMILSLIKKARSGDVAAYKELMDTGFGKVDYFEKNGDEDKQNIIIECPK